MRNRDTRPSRVGDHLGQAPAASNDYAAERFTRCARSKLAIGDPVPVSDKFGTGLEVSLAIVAEASNVPAAFGVKLKVRDTLCPAASAAGRVGDVNAKYLLEMASALMLTGAFPEFVALTMRVLLMPGATLPKFKAELARERFPR